MAGAAWRGAGKPLEPGLHVVSTPIGNLGDLTLRALDVLTRCDLILAEDTRVTAKLLAAFDIHTRVERYDDHADEARTAAIADRLAGGAVIALVSDAGTPLISDPGYRLVRAAAAQGIAVTAAPGASALLTALAICGLPTDRFLFAGFLPPKTAARRTALDDLRTLRATLVFYESGPRLAASLTDMAAAFGAREAVVARELTKLHETVIRGSLPALAADPRCASPKGEIVIVVAPGEAEAASGADVDAALEDALSRLGPSAAAAEVAKVFGTPKRALYQRALARKTSALKAEE